METFTTILFANQAVLYAFGPVVLGILGWLWTASQRRFEQNMAEAVFRQQVDQARLQWGSHVIDALSAAQAIAEAGPDAENFEIERREALQHLSALADRGRLFFPNLTKEGDRVVKDAFRLPWASSKNDADKEKSQAFRGNRPPIIDAIMYAYYELRAVGDTDGPNGPNAANYIYKCRRLFVSALQANIDPHRYDELVDRYSDQDRTHKADMLVRAGELGLLLDSRRSGLLTGCEGADFGWSKLISADRRREILHEAQSEEGVCPPLSDPEIPQEAAE